MLIHSPAKINLFLYVTGRRHNGYHDLFTLMACVDLYDEIELTFNNYLTSHPSGTTEPEPETTKPKINIRCNNPDIPQNESNIAFKAATLFNSCLSMIGGITPQGVNIKIKKNIPVGAGLGGGSSNAASVLKAMNHSYGSPFSVNKLMEMGLKLGADVPFFINNGIALAEGIGEKLTQVHFPEQHPQEQMCILLFYPGVGASTADVYKNLDLALTKPVKSNIKCLLKTSGIKQGFDSIKGLMHNDLEQTACALYPEIGLFRKELADCLPEKVMMTGSGSTFFSLFSDYDKAQRCFNELSAEWRFTKRQIFLTSFVN